MAWLWSLSSSESWKPERWSLPPNDLDLVFDQKSITVYFRPPHRFDFRTLEHGFCPIPIRYPLLLGGHMSFTVKTSCTSRTSIDERGMSGSN